MTNPQNTSPTVIWKLRLPMEDWPVLTVPAGAIPLTVQVQHGVPQLWIRCDPKAEPTPLRLRVAGTGHDLAGNVGRHVGSFQLHGGELVFHVFEVTT